MKNTNKNASEEKMEYIAPFSEFTDVDLNDIIRTSPADLSGTDTGLRDDESGIWTIGLY